MSRLRPRCAALSGAILSVCAIGTAASDDSAATLQDALARCAAISVVDQRLACYDGLAAGHTRIISPSSTSAVPQPPRSSTKEDFGLSTVQKQKSQPEQKQVESIKASVAGLGTSPIGRMLVELDNGQSWELDSADPLLTVGNAVTIERGALGSFLLTTPSRRTHHVRRIH
jgi:hypothetical protein